MFNKSFKVMNKKVYLFAFAAAAMFAACSNNDGAESAEKAQAQEKAQQIAVGFDAYQGRATTRAVTDLDALKTNSFGVFAYYTDNNLYDGQTIPNFMYNQKIDWSTDKWVYEPVKYWPNEAGNTAIAEEFDRISFFAYGPYVPITTLSTGKTANDKGIIGFSRNNVAGDPLVKYVADFNPANSVDLVWGTIGNGQTWQAYGGSSTAFGTEGKPWLDVQRPHATSTTWADASKVKFQFEHALASLNVQVISDVNKASGTAADADKYTRIWIRSISFTGFTTQGALNLNNIESKKALWKGINGDELVTGETVTIYDGRKDGKEATAGASNEKVLGLNPNLIQSADYALAGAGGGTDDANQNYAEGDLIMGDGKKPGVISIAQNLFDPTGVTGYAAKTAIKDTEPIYVIPTGDDLTVTIAYDVETVDNSLSTFLSDNKTHGSSISNVITKTIQVSSANLQLENGKQYTLNLHLGMNSVKFDAAVTDWTAGGAADNTNLPNN